MSTLICGSLAYDTIMHFTDRFTNYILPDQIDSLNVCFVTSKMRREFGGCAGNISYNLKLLGGEPVPMGTVGIDFSDYRNWLLECLIPDTFVRQIDDTYTAQCTITTDLDNNQITTFYPGAMADAVKNRISDARGISLGIIAPDAHDAMVQHSADFSDLGIPFLFDPGQNLPLFSKKEILACLDQSTWWIMNDYESKLFLNILGGTLDDYARNVEAMIITLGDKGSLIYLENEVIEIPSAAVTQALDPTGCGDAYRAGILHGLERKWDWYHTGRAASLMGALKIECHGTQNHCFSHAEFRNRYKSNFEIDFPS